LKILFPYLARVRSANWSRYQQLLAARARAGDRVRVLEPPPRRSEETNFQEMDVPLPSGFEVEEVRVARAIWDRRVPMDKLVKKGLYALAAGRRVRRVVREDPPDALLLYNLTHEAMLGLGPTTAFDVADDLPAMLRVEGGAIGAVLEPFARRALARMTAAADLVTTPSRVLQPRLGPRALFLPNGVDPEEIAGSRRAAEAAPRGRLRIGFLGSFEYFIDFDLVLGLARRLPEAELVLIGGGRRHAEIRRRAGREGLSGVRLTGPLPHARALALLAACDVSLAPFTRDPVGHGASPLKLFESLALAVPVVATRTDEILAESPPNVLLADSDEEAAARILQWRALPAETRREESERAAREICASRSWERIGNDWAEAVRAARR
jgi:glycosyltransferase involved in cell wall biosynthesis